MRMNYGSLTDVYRPINDDRCVDFTHNVGFMQVREELIYVVKEVYWVPELRDPLAELWFNRFVVQFFELGHLSSPLACSIEPFGVIWKSRTLVREGASSVAHPAVEVAVYLPRFLEA
jgi:hypothetical protein